MFLFSFFLFFFAHFHFPASGQAAVTGVVPSPPRFLPSIFIAHRVQQSHCSSIVHRVLLTHAFALSASQFFHKKKSQRIYTNMHSAGLEPTKVTYTRLEDNLIRYRGDRIMVVTVVYEHTWTLCGKRCWATDDEIGSLCSTEIRRRRSRPACGTPWRSCYTQSIIINDHSFDVQAVRREKGGLSKDTHTEEVPKCFCGRTLPTLSQALTDLRIWFPRKQILLGKAEM